MSNYSLTFDENIGLKIPSTDEVRSSVEEMFQEVFGTDIVLTPSSPQGQLITSLTAIITDKNEQMLKLANQFNPLTATGIFQEALGKLYFLERKTATPTIATCLCTGLNGTIIKEGSIIEDVQGIRYKSSQNATITNNSIEVTFICEEEGEIEAPADTLNNIVTVISGWDSVTNINAGITGQLEESQIDFEKRRQFSVAKNSHGGAYSVYAEIASIESVLDVVVLENTNSIETEKNGVLISPHSLFICVAGGDDSAIAEAIYSKKGAGCGTSGIGGIGGITGISETEVSTQISHTDTVTGAVYNYTITRPTMCNIYMKISLRVNYSTLADVETTVRNNILENFSGTETVKKVSIGDSFYASRFYATVIQAGIEELVSLELSTDNINFSNEIILTAIQYPVLTEENISFVVVQ